MTRFWILFAVLVAASSVFIFATRTIEGPAESVPGKRVEAPTSGSSGTLRIGAFAIGPEDDEPQVIAEFLVAVPGRFDIRRERRIPGAASISTSLAIGVTTPGLMARSRESMVPTTAAGVHCAGETRIEADGSFRLEAKVTQYDASGGSGSSCSIGGIWPGEFRVLTHPGFGASNGWWHSAFTLARFEPATSAVGDLDRWRAIITEALSSKWPNDAVEAASWIPCPAARAALVPLAKSDGPVAVARMMAGDPVDGPLLFGEAWQPRTIYLKHEALRPSVREAMNHAERRDVLAGPLLAKRLAADAQLTVRTVHPPGHAHDAVAWVVPLILLVSLSIAAAVAMLIRPPGMGAAAGALATACIFAVAQLKFGWVNFPTLIALPLLLYGSLALNRSLGGKSRWATAGAAVCGFVAATQIWTAWGAPTAVFRMGDLAFEFLPLLLFAATDSLEGRDSGFASSRSIKAYAMTVLLPSLTLILVGAANSFSAPAGSTFDVASPFGTVFFGLSIAGAFVTCGGFWSLRRRLLRLA